LALPPVEDWLALPLGDSEDFAGVGGDHSLIALRFEGAAVKDGAGEAQTLLSAFDPGTQAALWIGLRGVDQRLTVTIAPEPRRSPAIGTARPSRRANRSTFGSRYIPAWVRAACFTPRARETRGHRSPAHLRGARSGWFGPRG
jgi:hypothetical protein